MKYILINYKILSLAVNLILYKFKQIATMKARFLISKRKKKTSKTSKESFLFAETVMVKKKKTILWIKIYHKLIVLFHFSFVKGAYVMGALVIRSGFVNINSVAYCISLQRVQKMKIINLESKIKIWTKFLWQCHSGD